MRIKMFALLSAFVVMSFAVSAAPLVDPSAIAKQDPGIYALVDFGILPIGETQISEKGTSGTMRSLVSVSMKRPKTTAKIEGSRSDTRLPGDAKFVFKGRSYNPDGFVLVRLKSNDDNREVVTGKLTMMSKKSEIDSKDKVEVVVEKIDDNIFTIAPVSMLTPGEYGFIIKNSVNAERIYDFGVGGSLVASNK